MLAAFFFLNFVLAMTLADFPSVLLPVVIATVMTILLNIGAGQLVAWINKLGFQAGINAAFILQNRGEFALILATL
ncbi:hypothetical protein ACC691_40280, partial [Rhizobium johnstonii]|uniref:hypothetical protein n=1 Tax=Rhizobium johnstonii TaxID=3019933 RepID=UPI003F9E0084